MRLLWTMLVVLGVFAFEAAHSQEAKEPPPTVDSASSDPCQLGLRPRLDCLEGPPTPEEQATHQARVSREERIAEMCALGIAPARYCPNFVAPAEVASPKSEPCRDGLLSRKRCESKALGGQSFSHVG